MSNQKLFIRGLVNALLVAVYVFFISFFLSNGSSWFEGAKQSFWIPFVMLMLLVISAAVVGSLIFGKPILMYWENQKKEAVKLLGYTLAWLFIVTAIVLLLNIK